MTSTTLPVHDRQPKHLRGTEAARTVDTPELRGVRLGLEAIADVGGAITVDGRAGMGKTFATDLIFHELGIDGYWVTMPHRPRGKETTARIHEAVTGQRVSMRMNTEYELFGDIIDALAGRHIILAIDEAQHLPSGSLNQLRYLYDHSDTKLVLLLVGVDLTESLRRRCEPLMNRVEKRVHFRPYTKANMARFLKDYHPLFSNSGEEAIRVIIEAASGNLRTAATLLKAALSLSTAHRKGLTTDQARAAVRFVSGGAS